MSRFARVAESNTEYSALHLGFLYCYDDELRTAVYLTQPGEYTLTVKATTSQGSATSRPFAITIRRPLRDEARAFKMWEGLGVAGTISMVFEQKGDQDTVETFRRLGKDYPETPYGRYARASIALWDMKTLKSEISKRHRLKAYEALATESRYRGKPDQLSAIEYLRSHPEELEWLKSQPADPDWTPVIEGLHRAATAFGRGHLLRQRVLFELASAQASAKHPDAARKTLLALRDEYTERDIPERITRLLVDIDRMLEKAGNRGQSKEDEP